METIMTKQPPTLEERIDVALQPDAAVTSDDLAALIEETETYIAKADQGWNQRPSLDPGAAHQAMMRSSLTASSAMALISISSVSMVSGSRIETPAWHKFVAGS